MGRKKVILQERTNATSRMKPSPTITQTIASNNINWNFIAVGNT